MHVYKRIIIISYFIYHSVSKNIENFGSWLFDRIESAIIIIKK